MSGSRGGGGPRTWWGPHLWFITLTVHLTYAGSRLLLTYRVLDLGGSAQEVGLMIALGSLAPLLVVVRAGRFLDEHSPSRPLLVGGATVTLGIVLLATAGSLPVLGVASTLLGLGHLLAMMSSQSYVPKYADEAQFDRSFGALTLAASVGQTLGLPLVAVVELLASEGAGPDVAVRGLWVMAVLSLALLPSALFLVTGQGRLGVPARRDELPDRTPVRELLGLAGMPAAMVSSLAVLASMDLLAGYLPLLGEERGWSVAAVSLLLTTRAVASMASRIWLGQLLAAVRRDVLILSATGVSGLAVLLLPFLDSVVLTGIAMAVIGFFWGIGQPLTMSWVVQISPARDRSSALSLRLAGNRIGQVVVPLALGVVAARSGVGAVFVGSSLLLGGATEAARRALAGGRRV